MNIEDAIKAGMAGSLLFAAFMFLVVAVMLVSWFGALVHCIKHRHDKDRLMWVLIVLFGGPIGAFLYYVMGRQPSSDSGLTIARPRSPVPEAPLIDFDHSAIHDEKRRVQAISQALGKNTRE